MLSRALLAAALMYLVAADRAAAQTMLDLLPHDATLSIAVRNREELAKKEGKIFPGKEKLEITGGFDSLDASCRIKVGVKRNAPTAFLFAAPAPGKLDHLLDGFHYNLMVHVVPFIDADAIADNFDFPKGRLTPKNVLKFKDERDDHHFATSTGTHLIVAGSEKKLQQYQQRKPLTQLFSVSQRKRLNDCDLVANVSSSVLATLHDDLRNDFLKKLRPGSDPLEQKFADDLMDGLKDIHGIALGVRLDDGIDAHFIAAAPEKSNAVKLIASLTSKRRSSTLAGLPDGNVLIAHAYAGDSAQHAWLANAFFRYFLESPLLNERLVASANLANSLSILSEVWGRLQGNRFAVYQNAEEAKLGVVSAVIILDCDDPPGFLREMKTLARMAAADSLDWSMDEVKKEFDIDRLVRELASAVYTTRQAAATRLALIGEPALPALQKALSSKKLDLETTRRAADLERSIRELAVVNRKDLFDERTPPLLLRPQLTFVTAAEKRLGQSIDVIHLKMTGSEKFAHKRYTQLLGPDWDKVRVAVVGKQIVVMVGSDVARFEAALKNAQEKNAGLAASKRLAPFYEKSEKDRLFEFHVSEEGKQRLLAQKGNLGPPVHLTSMSLSLGATSIQVDVRVPTSELRAHEKQPE